LSQQAIRVTAYFCGNATQMVKPHSGGKKGGKLSKLRVASFSISLDGYGAGPNQSIENPQGVGGMSLHKWAFATRTIKQHLPDIAGAVGVTNVTLQMMGVGAVFTSAHAILLKGHV
jgi:hypothetical protein